ncbi:MAG: hypothetical protein TH68_08655 [Candidatus Synechococcus spongiarum 142]|uniref:Uncharacterized protein n=1 Tax=Candidatus Synechococcus spongiarum 142 TaxID=1608213 RepID=A0A6N3XBC8_9SYNE|nr:MAG: hypothetical protein TH68_08655 [Candidatus Synechococcus spongiarum 142]
MPGETVGLIRCCTMDSRFCSNGGMGTRTDCSWREGIPWGRLNQALADCGSSPCSPRQKLEPQQPAPAGLPSPLPIRLPNPQARTRAFPSDLLTQNPG